MMNKISKYFLFLFLSFCVQNAIAEDYELVSPGGNLKVKLSINGSTQYELWAGSTQLIASSPIAMNLEGGTVIGAGTVKNTERNSINTTISVLIGKNKTLDDIYNEIIVHYNENYDLIFRAYDDGVAYRFQTALGGEIIVKTEDAIFNFAGNPTVYFPQVNEFDPQAANPKLDHWEKSYKIYTSIDQMKSKILAVTPVLFSYPTSNHKVVIYESGLLDYPALYIQQNGSQSVRGYWAQYPKTVDQPNNMYSNHYPITRFDYIAKTQGTRSFPWRVMVVSDDDKQLLNNELVYKLAEPCKLTNVSWILPGKTTWEWGHKAILTEDGKADLSRGIPANGGGTKNLSFKLYKYYVDFAVKNNIQYLTLDAGWSDSYIRQLCDYAKSKGVKIIVWTWASCAVDNANWMKNMKDYGISGFKIDFVNRSDQPATNWLEQLAIKAAELEMVVMYHGCPVPTGLNRTYPNILNYEAVRGEENNYWDGTSNPDYQLEIPFIRMLAGAFDYTPGSMHNITKDQFRPIDTGEEVPGTIPNAMGTRCHELAMYVIFDQPLGYLVDSPTEYEKYPDILEYFQKVPTVWDKTIPLSAEFGKYAVIAKQTGENWFVAGMTSWEGRTVDVDFSFLPENVDFQATVYKDAPLSDGYPKRYECEEIVVNKQTKLNLRMANGGGFTIMLAPQINSSVNDLFRKTDDFQITFTNKILEITSKEKYLQHFNIYNIAGQLVLNKAASNIYSQQIDLSALHSGTYVLEIETLTSVDFFKFIYL